MVIQDINMSERLKAALALARQRADLPDAAPGKVIAAALHDLLQRAQAGTVDFAAFRQAVTAYLMETYVTKDAETIKAYLSDAAVQTANALGAWMETIQLDPDGWRVPYLNQRKGSYNRRLICAVALALYARPLTA